MCLDVTLETKGLAIVRYVLSQVVAVPSALKDDSNDNWTAPYVVPVDRDQDQRPASHEVRARGYEEEKDCPWVRRQAQQEVGCSQDYQHGQLSTRTRRHEQRLAYGCSSLTS